jgi:7-cyano-7-deazaguanine synthase
MSDTFKTMKKAIILLSGGIDSTVCAYIAKQWGHEVYALSFDYGQRHLCELQAAALIAQEMGAVEHKTLSLPTLGAITNEQPYVPARNTIFLSLALGYTEVIGATDLFIGINADDVYFPDCSPKFFHAFNSLAAVATKTKIRLNAPLLNLSKTQIIQKGIALGVPFEKTLTCYAGTNCAVCPACKIRCNAFSELGISDPLKYQHD